MRCAAILLAFVACNANEVSPTHGSLARLLMSSDPTNAFQAASLPGMNKRRRMQRPVMAVERSSSMLPFEKMALQDRRQAVVSLALAAASLFSSLPAYAAEEKKKKKEKVEFPTAPGLGKGIERFNIPREKGGVQAKMKLKENRILWNSKPGTPQRKASRRTNYRNYLPLSQQNAGYRPDPGSDCKGFFPKRGLACPGGKLVPQSETRKPGWKNPLIEGDLMFGTSRAPNSKKGLEDVKLPAGRKY